MYVVSDILFHQITTFIKVCVGFVFWLQILYLIYFSKIYQLKGLKPKNNGQTNFYECCDLTKKVYLRYLVHVAYIVDSIMKILGLWIIILPTHT